MTLNTAENTAGGYLPGSAAALEARERLEHEREVRVAQLPALEQAAAKAEDDSVFTRLSAVRHTLEEIDQAFARLERGGYGSCLRCETAIPAERLEILPYTPHCVTCRRRVG